MELLLPAVLLVLSLGATWLFCIRPMRNGQHCLTGRSDDISDLRAQVAQLRAEQQASRGQ